MHVLCSCPRCFLDLGVTSEFLSNYLTGEASSVVVRGLDAGNRCGSPLIRHGALFESLAVLIT